MPQKLRLLAKHFESFFPWASYLSLVAVSQTVDRVQEMKEGKRAYEAKNYTLAESRFVSATKNAESDASHHEYQVVGLEALASVYCAESKTGELGRVFDQGVEAYSKLSLDPDHRASFLWDHVPGLPTIRPRSVGAYHVRYALTNGGLATFRS